MRFSSLGSGSRGNGTLVHYGDTYLLVDCGFSLRETTKRLALRGIEPDQLSAILVTHEHSDHIKGVGYLAQKFNLPVFMSSGTWQKWRRRNSNALAKNQIVPVVSGQRFSVDEIEVEPIMVPHDSAEPIQYLFFSQHHQLGLLTDVGSITAKLEQAYGNCHGLILECNHDREMLWQGPYPQFLKQRVAGDYGHLSNCQAKAFLESIDVERLQHLVVAHISEQNNSSEQVSETLSEWSEQTPASQVHLATQQEGFDWLELA